MCPLKVCVRQNIAWPEFWVQDRDWDFISGSLIDETGSRLFFLLSLNIEMRPRHFFLVLMLRQDWDFFLLSFIVKMRPSFFSPKSQFQDETETISESQNRDENETFYLGLGLLIFYINNYLYPKNTKLSLKGGRKERSRDLWKLVSDLKCLEASCQGILWRRMGVLSLKLN